MMDYTIPQPGRAALDFLAALGVVNAPLTAKANAAIAAAGVSEEKLAEDLDARANQVEVILAAEPAWRGANLLGEWHAEHHARLASEAFHSMESDLKPAFETLQQGKTSIRVNAALDVPKYWLYPVHRTTGGWDKERHMGFIHGELIHRYLLNKLPRPPAAAAGDIYAQRKQTAEEFKALSSAAQDAGVQNKMFGVFHDAGYHASHECRLLVATRACRMPTASHA